ncbi:MAG: fibronectin type III domain-containing protein [Gammaproteobacteria bacterium]|nr:fibronectin type III domain-containing protein [Gammaproteobacteria bacterium]
MPNATKRRSGVRVDTAAAKKARWNRPAVASWRNIANGSLLAASLAAAATASPDVSHVARVPLFPAASNDLREGFVRVVNRSTQAGDISIAAIDDAGMRVEGPALGMGAGETRHFNSADLEDGNPAKGLTGGTGPGTGDWRLQLSSELGFEVLAYVRTADGFLTAMHDVVERGLHGHRVATFNPGRNSRQRSLLRLVNPGETETEVTISAMDDAGMAAAGTVTLTLPAGGARTLSSAELESAETRTGTAGETGLVGELGTGSGKWQLLVASQHPVVVMSLLISPLGHLTNLSTAPNGRAAGAGVIRQMAEDTQAGAAIGAPVTANLGDPAGRAHDLEGADASSFDIETATGQLLAGKEARYDFETRTAYALIVRVSDASGSVLRIPVTVEVTDVDEPPGRPEPPEVEGVSSRSVRVTWAEPSNTGPPIVDYDVEYRRPGAAEYTDAEHEGAAREIEISHLRERADYEFRVRASNDEGSGEWSEPTLGRARTGGGGGGGTVTPPPVSDNDPPLFVEGADASRELAENSVGNLDVGLPVEATDADDDPVTYGLEGADAASFTVVADTGQLRTRNDVDYNFEAKDRYSIRVVADDGKGGRASIDVTVELTDEDGEAPGKPAEPLLTGATTTSLTVTWTPPDNSGPAIVDYDLGYRVLNTGSFADWPHHGTATSATIENLDHSTIYQVVVKARNDEGTGLNSARLLATTRAPRSTEPVWVRDSSREEEQGSADGIPVTLIDRGFGPDSHGGRVTATYMNSIADADKVLYTQTDGGRTYRLEGLLFSWYSDFLVSGYVRHALRYGDGIVWTASDQTTHYRPGDFDWFVENGRPFKKTAKAFADWMKDRNVLFVSSMENITARHVGDILEAVYCDDYHAGGFDGRGWIPLCGEIDDYIAHSGVGQEITVFAGSIDRGAAIGAIRGDGVFAANSIYVESPRGSTSHATAVLAAYASALKAANPTWTASKLRRELMRIAREQEYDYITGTTNASNSLVTERRTIRLILPAFAPGTGNHFPEFSSSASFSAAENQTTAGTVEATDTDTGDTVTGYEVVGGADSAQFEVSGSGALRFKTAPDFENPADVDGDDPDSKAEDNDYIVVVQASSGSGNRLLTAQQRITVSVTDETE